MTATSRTRDDGLGGVLRHGDLAVVLVGLLLLLAGWLVRGNQTDGAELHRFHGLSLSTPAGWMSLPRHGPPSGTPGLDRRQVLTDLLVTDTFKPRVTLVAETLPPGFKPTELTSYVEINLQQRMDLFHPIRSRTLKIGTHPAVRVDYAHAINPSARPDDPTTTDIPVAVRGSTLVVLDGDTLLQVTVEQSVAQQRIAPGLADDMLASIRLAGGR